MEEIQKNYSKLKNIFFIKLFLLNYFYYNIYYE